MKGLQFFHSQTYHFYEFSSIFSTAKSGLAHFSPCILNSLHFDATFHQANLLHSHAGSLSFPAPAKNFSKQEKARKSLQRSGLRAFSLSAFQAGYVFLPEEMLSGNLVCPLVQLFVSFRMFSGFFRYSAAKESHYCFCCAFVFSCDFLLISSRVIHITAFFPAVDLCE